MQVRVAKAVYDFSKQGGAVSDISLKVFIPKGAVIKGIIHEELTDVTSGGAATVTLKAGTTALTGLIAKATFTGIVTEALAGSVGAIRLTAAAELKATIATAALTAGKVAFYVEYYV